MKLMIRSTIPREATLVAEDQILRPTKEQKAVMMGLAIAAPSVTPSPDKDKVVEVARKTQTQERELILKEQTREELLLPHRSATKEASLEETTISTKILMVDRKLEQANLARRTREGNPAIASQEIKATRPDLKAATIKVMMATRTTNQRTPGTPQAILVVQSTRAVKTLKARKEEATLRTIGETLNLLTTGTVGARILRMPSIKAGLKKVATRIREAATTKMVKVATEILAAAESQKKDTQITLLVAEVLDTLKQMLIQIIKVVKEEEEAKSIRREEVTIKHG